MLLLAGMVGFSAAAWGQTTYTWTGAVDSSWSTGANWNPVGVPTDGDSLAFPPGVSITNTTNDFPAGRSFARLAVNGSGYTLGGNPIVLTEGIVSTQYARYEMDIELQGSGVVFQAPGAVISGTLSGNAPLRIGSSGQQASQSMVLLSGTHAYDGVITVPYECVSVCAFGQLLLQGAQLPDADVVSNFVLSGNGALGSLSTSGINARLSPGPDTGGVGSRNGAGLITTADLALQEGYTYMDLGGTTPGSGHDQLAVTGTVSLGIATLNLARVSEYSPLPGDAFVLIDNDGVDPVSGTFEELPEGSTTTIDGAFDFLVSYAGGDGNDVVVTSTLVPRVWTGAVSASWSDAANWEPAGIPASGESLLFPSGVMRTASSNDLTGLSLERLVITGSGYTLSGNEIVLTGVIVSTAPATIALPIDVQAGTIGLHGPQLHLSGALSGTGNVHVGMLGQEQSTARVFLSGAHAFSGAVSVHRSCTVTGRCRYGTLSLDGASMPAASFDNGYMLNGHGSIGALDTGGAYLSPGDNSPYGNGNGIGGIATADLNLQFGYVYLDIAGNQPGVTHDLLEVTGSVLLGLAPAYSNLTLQLAPAFIPALGESFVLIDNDGADAVTGTFRNLPEGATITLNGVYDMQLSYVGGDGNDVAVTTTVSPRIWSGGVSALWSEAANWSPVGIPVNGDTLLFPDGATNTATTNDLPDLALVSISITGTGYVLDGNPVSISRQVVSSSSATLSLPVEWLDGALGMHGQNLRVDGSMSGSATIAASVAGQAQATSQLRFSGAHEFAGTLQSTTTCTPSCSFGYLYWDGASMPTASIVNGNDFTGNGRTGPFRSTSRMYLGPDGSWFGSNNGSGRLTTGDLELSGLLSLDIIGVNAGLSYDQLAVIGSVTLGSPTASLTLSNTFVPALGQAFVLLDNDGTDAVSGTFSGLAEGATVTLNGAYDFRISYAGGDGNDVVLTSLNGKLVSTTTLASSLNPAVVGDEVTFTASVSGDAGMSVGNVVFRAGATELGTVALAGGEAILSTSSLAAGVHSITAEYGGDTSYGGSSSAALEQTVLDRFTVTPVAGTGGTLAPSTPQQVVEGATIAFTVTPDANHALDSIVGCGGTLVGDVYTTAAITADCSVEATFYLAIEDTTTAISAVAPSPSTIGGSVGISIQVTGAFTAPADGQVQVSASTGESCTDNDGASVAGAVATFSCAITFATAGERTLSAAFGGSASHADSGSAATTTHDVLDLFTVTPVAGTGGALSPSTPQQVVEGATTVFTATPDTRYAIESVSGCGGALDGAVYTTAAISADCSVEASFVVVIEDTGSVITAVAPSPSIEGESVAVTVEVTGTSTAPGDGQVQVSASTGESCTDSDGASVAGAVATFSCDITFADAGERGLTAAFSGSAWHADSATTVPAEHAVLGLYGVGGVLSGLAEGNAILLRNNGGDDLSLSANGAFAFATRIVDGESYAVTLASQPGTPPQTCVVGAGEGTVDSEDIADVIVACTTDTIAALDADTPVRFGQPTTYTVSVQADSGAPADGQVEVRADSGELCIAAAADLIEASASHFSCAITHAALGPATVSAQFSGSSTHSGSTSAEFEQLVMRFVDVSVSAGDGTDDVHTGQEVEYLVELRNAGPDDAPGSSLLVSVTPALHVNEWSCIALGTADCPAASGYDDIAEFVDLPADSGLDFVVHGYLDAELPGSVVLQADTAVAAGAPGFVFDTDASNDSAADENTVDVIFGDGFDEDLFDDGFTRTR